MTLQPRKAIKLEKILKMKGELESFEASMNNKGLEKLKDDIKEICNYDFIEDSCENPWEDTSGKAVYLTMIKNMLMKMEEGKCLAPIHEYARHRGAKKK